MVQRRAVTKEDKALQPDSLPTLYKTLIPLTPDRHQGYFLSQDRNYDFVSMANAIPVTVDEFPQVMRHYPIVLAGGATPTPVALVGYKPGVNDHVDKDGKWSDGTYIPAYLRRYPFAYIRESQEAERHILCADLSSTLFSTSGTDARALFDAEGKPAKVLNDVMDFCTRYDQSVQRTQAVIKEAVKLGLIDPSEVTISRKGQNLKVEGFNIISEQKLRELPDETLAGLTRRGVLPLFTAHHLSMTNFAGFGQV
ncbi:MAG: SapC family protein [Sedimentitalea sp.]